MPEVPGVTQFAASNALVVRYQPSTGNVVFLDPNDVLITMLDAAEVDALREFFESQGGQRADADAHASARSHRLLPDKQSRPPIGQMPGDSAGVAMHGQPVGHERNPVHTGEESGTRA